MLLKNIWKLSFFLLVGIFSLSSLHPEASAATETPEQFQMRFQAWRDAEFGMFIHWGLYSIPADRTDKNGKLAKNTPFSEWYYFNKQIKDMKEYEKFADQFNPLQFDAKKWVKAAKDAGMKYIVVTTKHHDGFSMFEFSGTTSFRRNRKADSFLLARCNDKRQLGLRSRRS